VVTSTARAVIKGKLHPPGFGYMIEEDDPELEYSPLCGDVSRGGITIRVEIYRLAGRGEGWSLEVVDQEGGSTVWDDLFATDQ
jgi:hypothetical protein